MLYYANSVYTIKARSNLCYREHYTTHYKAEEGCDSDKLQLCIVTTREQQPKAFDLFSNN